MIFFASLHIDNSAISDDDLKQTVTLTRQSVQSKYNKQYIVGTKSYMQQYNHLYTKRISVSRDIIE